MLNFFVNNALTGHEYSLSKCTCGYSKKHYKNNTYEKEILCPDCGVPMVQYEKQTSLAFGSIHEEDNIFYIKGIKDKICAVEMYLYRFNGSYHIDFENKDIIFEEYNNKDDKQSFKIVFDGTLKEDEMFKAYDLLTNAEVSMQSIIDSCKYNNFRIVKRVSNFENFNNFMTNNFYHTINKSNLSSIRTYLNKYKATCTKCELLIKAGIDPGHIDEQFRNGEGTNPADFLNIKPYMVKYLRQNNSNGLINTLVRIDKLFGDQGVHYLNTFGQESKCMNISFIENIHELIKEANLSISKLYKFLYKDAPMQQGLYSVNETLRLLYDSFNLSKLLELPFDKNPKALVRYHDILTREYNTIKDEIINKKFAEKVKKYDYLNYCPDKSKFAIVVPKESQDLVREGKLMRHCVASYIDKVAEGKSIVAFLRKTEDIDAPYVTIEVSPHDYSIVQVKKKHNERLTNEKAIDFVNEWCKENTIVWQKGQY